MISFLLLLLCALAGALFGAAAAFFAVFCTEAGRRRMTCIQYWRHCARAAKVSNNLAKG
jgi:hypothetical protein